MNPQTSIINSTSYIPSDIYQEILLVLEHEDHIILATIISTSGSTPASSLSKMIIKNGGTISVGTIGGGCMEGKVIFHANRLYNTGKTEILTFELNEDDIESGLICGGSLDVLIEPITREFIPIYQKIKSLRENGEDCVLGTLLKKDMTIESKIIFRRGNGLLDKWIVDDTLNHSTTQLLPPSITPQLQQSIILAYQKNEVIRLKLESGELILEPIRGVPRLIVFGGGHVSKFVSQVATMSGFQVTVIDDREKFANPQRFPEASKTIVADFSDAFKHLTINDSTYIVIVTRGHKYDEIVLEQAVKTNAKYIGMIGSKRKVQTIFDHLREQGITEKQLKKVHAPIGIDIGAVTIEEIAVSIVAEMIRVRRGLNKPLQSMSETMK
ncbi:MAG: XdhC/CoxI family protein [candidate division WOR-3 bacterium]